LVELNDHREDRSEHAIPTIMADERAVI
jgi:hypothetical protein